MKAKLSAVALFATTLGSGERSISVSSRASRRRLESRWTGPLTCSSQRTW